MKQNLRISVLLVLCALLLSGCFHPQPVFYQGFQPVAPARLAAASPEPAPLYRLQPDDLVEIKFFYNPELNEKQRVRPDGRISLQLIQDVEVAGLTPVQLQSLLMEKYTGRINQLEISVILQELAGQKVFVGGEVQRPGFFSYSGKLTALQAIFMAGGFKDSARLGSVVVLRDQGSAQPLYRIINLKKDLYSGRQGSDLPLQPYDVIFVPKTTIARINQFVDQYIRQLLPVSTTFGFSYMNLINQ